MTYCLSGSVKLKAGTAVSSALTDANYSEWIQQAEAIINAKMRINLSGSYGTLNADVKRILEDAASSHAAMNAIYYDSSGYTSREARTLLNINYTRFNDAIQELKDKKVTDYLQNPQSA